MDKNIISAINAAIDKYRDGGNIELELRFKDITKNIFESVFENASGDPYWRGPTFEYSINFISKGVDDASKSSSFIKTIIFDGTKPRPPVHVKKTRLIAPITIADFVKYTINVSAEKPIEPFETMKTATVRFKIRASFTCAGPWRLDLTAIREGPVQHLGPILVDIVKETFGAIKQEKFIESLAELPLKFEIELEHDNSPIEHDADIIGRIFALVDTNYQFQIVYQSELVEVMRAIIPEDQHQYYLSIGPLRLKKITNQVNALTKYIYYSDIYGSEMLFTIKADGERALLRIVGNRYRLLKSDSFIEAIVDDDLHVYRPGPITILDCEIISGGVDLTTTVLRVFDVIMLLDEPTQDLGAETRIKYLRRLDELHDSPCKLIAAIYARATGPAEYRAAIEKIMAEPREYPTDGIIITMPTKDYFNTNNYKWKEYINNTIDFLAMKCPQTMMGLDPYFPVEGYDLYLLFVGIDEKLRTRLGLSYISQYRKIFPRTDVYAPIQFSPSADSYAYIYYHPIDNTREDINGAIIELGRNEANTIWKYHRTRYDRKAGANYYGNDFRTAETTYNNYLDPFRLEDLWKRSDSYFVKSADTASPYFAANKFQRFVIGISLKEIFSGAEKMIDLAGGRGADMNRYMDLQLRSIFVIDKDTTALSELVSRKFSTRRGGIGDPLATAYDRIHNSAASLAAFTPAKTMSIHIAIADLTEKSASELVALGLQFGYLPATTDGIVCNFALHYFCADAETIENVLEFCSRMLAIGKSFMFVVMDGKSIFELLGHTKTREQWRSKSGKYAIRRDFAGATLSEFGQQISVKLPFTDELVPEWLCNIGAVCKCAKKFGFVKSREFSMGAYCETFAEFDPVLSAKMAAEDVEYVSLYHAVVLTKRKKYDAVD